MNEINNLIKKNSTIALIGNGGSLLKFESGDLIDSHEVIIRFNNFNVSDSYKKYAGTKTTFWATTFYQDIIPRNDSLQIVCPLPLNVQGYTQIYDTNLNLLIGNLTNTIFIPEEIFKELCNMMPIHKTKKRKDPSTGLCMIYWLIKSGFNIKRKNLFGFDFFSNSNHHYFSKGPPPSINHEGDIEKSIIEKLLK
jgi:hypothetical protein